MYDPIGNLKFDILFQGDILEDFPFFIFDQLRFVSKDGVDQFKIKNEDDEPSIEDLSIVQSRLSTVMILSQSCDTQRRDNIIICPVYLISEYIQKEVLNEKTVGNLRARKYNYWFYLPALQDVIEESLADLQQMYYLPKEVVDSYKAKKIITLSDFGRHHLAWSLTTFFGRPITSRV